jgi:hypothetical protein
MSAGRVMVVIVNWHDWDSTRAAIESIYRGVGPVHPQVLIVDNEQQEHPPALPDGVIVVPQERNLGYAGGNNVGIRLALRRDPRPEFVLIMNNDCMLVGRALEAMVDLMDSHPDAGIVGPVIQNLDGTHQTSGAKLTFWSIKRCPTAPQDVRAVDFVSGACMLVRVTVFEEVGFLDEQFFHYGEDVDFCVRVRASGHKIIVAPDAVAQHRRHNSLGGASPQLGYYAVRNSILFARKHGVGRVGWAAVIRHVVPVRTILRGDWVQVTAAWAGLRDGLQGVGGMRP